MKSIIILEYMIGFMTIFVAVMIVFVSTDIPTTTDTVVETEAQYDYNAVYETSGFDLSYDLDTPLNNLSMGIIDKEYYIVIKSQSTGNPICILQADAINVYNEDADSKISLVLEGKNVYMYNVCADICST